MNREKRSPAGSAFLLQKFGITADNSKKYCGIASRTRFFKKKRKIFYFLLDKPENLWYNNYLHHDTG